MSRPRPRVLQVGPVPPPVEGGISAYVGGLLRSSVGSDFELLPFDVRVPSWARRVRPLRSLTSAQFLSGFVRTLRQTQPDLVHIHSSAYMSFWEKTAMGRLAARRGIPWILHLHDGYFESFLRELGNPLSELARRHFASAAAVISVCDGWEPWLQPWTADTALHCIPNAIDSADFTPLGASARGNGTLRTAASNDKPRLLYLADVTEAKGILDLGRALQSLRLEGHRFHVDVVGDGSAVLPRQAVAASFEAWGLAEVSTFHGPLYGEARLPLLQAADIFVAPSHVESFCIANVEAMACGLPVVSTRTGAIPEVVRHAREGLLAEPRDVAALTDNLATLLRDVNLRQRLGAAARQRAQRYDWSRVAQDVSALYHDVLQTQAAPLPQVEAFS